MNKEIEQISALCVESKEEAKRTLVELDISGLNVDDSLSAGALAEKLGLLDLAISVYNHALDTEPKNKSALRSLACIRTDQGDWQRAETLLERLEQAGDESAAKLRVEVLAMAGKLERAKDAMGSLPGDSQQQLLAFMDEQAPERSADAQAGIVSASDADIMALLDLFSSRQGVYARQWCSPDGRSGYSPVRQALTPSILRQHLAGMITIGLYVVRHENTCCFLAFDLDVDANARRRAKDSRDFERYIKRSFSLARAIGKELAGMGLGFAIENSGGKGHHVWTFFAEPIDAAKVRKFGLSVLASVRPLPEGVSAEVFPAQGRVKPRGLGNLIKMPLGIHQRSGRRSVLLDANEHELSDAVGHLLSLPRLDKSAFMDLFQSVPPVIDLRADDNAAHGQSEDGDAQEKDEPYLSRERLVPTEPPYYLDEDAELTFLLERCTTLRRLVGQARAGKALSHDEQSVLIYTLGHLGRGADAVNALFQMAGHPPPLKSPLRGHPTSCRKIRAKLGISPSDEQCMCSFDPTLGSYEHPMLHLAALRAEEKLVKGEDVALGDDERLRLDREIARLRTLRMRLDASAKERVTGTDGAAKPDGADSGAAVIPFPMQKPKEDES